jgi:2-keto-3-deoxy-L-rhamnonate aldolase RhmA
MLSGDPMAGTFLKTPAYQLVEVLAQSRLDFICLDAEHAPFGRAALDACLGMARALDFPALVRVADGSASAILQALDCGAAGVVVPHVDSAAKAAEVARAARFGPGGRGFAGSTRWAGYGTRPMAAVLGDGDQTTLIVQIEDPEGVAAAERIAATPGVDGLFIGPADLSVGHGATDQDGDALKAALASVGQAARAHGRAYMSFVANAAQAAEWRKYGMSVFFIGSEHGWMRTAADAQADGIHDLKSGG